MACNYFCAYVYCYDLHTAACDNFIELVNESTDSQGGQVEVCGNGRWGTVCYNNQEEIAEFVCYQQGFSRRGTVRHLVLYYSSCTKACAWIAVALHSFQSECKHI